MPQPKKCECPVGFLKTDCEYFDKHIKDLSGGTFTKPIPQNEKSDQPKPEEVEFVRCEHSGTDYRRNCKQCKPSPASTEEWEERYKTMAVFETYSVPKIVIDDTLDFIRSHDQQLRQRIVEALEEKKIGQNVVINAVGRSIGQNNVCEAEKMNTYNQAITDAITFITNLK